MTHVERKEELRNRAIWRAGHRCELCGQNPTKKNGRSGLYVHHLTYERKGWERLADVRILCFRCHRRWHGARYSLPAIRAERKKQNHRSAVHLTTKNALAEFRRMIRKGDTLLRSSLCDKGASFSRLCIIMGISPSKFSAMARSEKLELSFRNIPPQKLAKLCSFIGEWPDDLLTSINPKVKFNHLVKPYME